MSNTTSVNSDLKDSSESLPTNISVYNSFYNYLCVTLTNKEAKMPVKGSEYAAGYDLFSNENVKIPAWKKAVINTNIQIHMPPGVYGRIASRSGLSVKNDLEVGAGVIDADYRGDIKVVLRNFSDTDYNVKQGDKIAQLILESYYSAKIKKISNINDIFGSTNRGSGGFGSTGK